MATAINFASSSPRSCVLTVVGNGGAATRTRAELLGFCQAGPLREALARTLDWTAFNLGGARCGDIHVRELVNRAPDAGGAASITFEFFWTADGIKADCLGEVGRTATHQLDLRLVHSERF